MTARLSWLLAGLLGWTAAACAPLPAPESPAQATVPPPGPAARLQVQPSREDLPPRFIGLIGTKAQHAPPFLGVPETNFYCLRSFIDRQTGETQHQLYVSDSYSGAERHWNAARDDAGHPLRFVEISRNEITCDRGCSYVEEFAVNLPENELRASPRGLTVIFTAASGAEKRIAVSGAQATAQLAAVDAQRSPARLASSRAIAPAKSGQPSTPTGTGNILDLR
jgi:hypothetical protein